MLKIISLKEYQGMKMDIEELESTIKNQYDEIAQCNKKIGSFTGQKGGFVSHVNSLKQRIDELFNDKTKLQNDINALNTTIELKDQLITSQENEIKSLNEKILDQQKSYNNLNDLMKRISDKYDKALTENRELARKLGFKEKPVTIDELKFYKATGKPRKILVKTRHIQNSDR